MGASSSSLKSKPSKFFKRASFRSKKKKKDGDSQTVQQPTSAQLQTTPAIQLNGTSLRLSNGNGSTPGVDQQSQVETSVAAVPGTVLESQPADISISTVYTSTLPANGSSVPGTAPGTAPGTPKLNGSTRAKVQKEKSRSMAFLPRRSGSMKSTKGGGRDDTNKSASASTWSLKRFGSLRSITSRRGRSSKAKRAQKDTEDALLQQLLLDPAEIPPADDVCYFTRLYESKLHQRIFAYFSFPEKMSYRSVCKRWQVDLLKEAPSFFYPIFHASSPLDRQVDTLQAFLEESRQAMISSNRYLYYCSNVQTLLITERLTRTLLDNLVKYCFSKRLSRVVFAPRNGDKCEIIPSNVLEAWSSKFGRQLREVAVHSRLSNGTINSDLTDVILFLLYTNSESFDHLVDFELQIANKLTNGYFQMFQSEFGAQLRRLTVELSFDVSHFTVEATKTVERIGSTMGSLKSLSISLLPKLSEGSSSPKLSLQPLVDLIGRLPRTLESIESFTLAVDISQIDAFTLDLVRPLARFNKAKALSLIIYGDIKQVDQCQLMLDFTHLELNTFLRSLTLDSSKLSDSDLQSLVNCTPNLRHLTLACDVRVSCTSVYSLASLGQLQSLTIRQSSGAFGRHGAKNRKTSEPLATKEALFIDNAWLCALLACAPGSMTALRSLHLENCRIDMEDSKVLELLVSWTMRRPEEMFTIRLAHNRFPLPVVPKFYLKYTEFIPKNLKLSWG